MTREQAQKKMFSAQTLAQCAEAWEARAAYLQKHPDAKGILEEGEALHTTEQGLKRLTAKEIAA